MKISFKFVPEKALAAIHWMVLEQPGVDLHTLLKACYFADKDHLNEFDRPIFGATYRAMPFGPVPLEIYEMAKSEPMWLAQLGLMQYPWWLDGYRLRRKGNDDPDQDALSDSDWQSLRSGFSRSRGMTFDKRTAVTHGPDWQRANLGLMDYADMLDDGPDKDDRVTHLLENARFMRL